MASLIKNVGSRLPRTDNGSGGMLVDPFKSYKSTTHNNIASKVLSQPKTSTTKNYYGGSGSNSKSDILAILQQGAQDELDSALNALKEKLNAQIGFYETQLADNDANYEKLIDQSEVNRYKSKDSIREALANRGQLDSGYGRQEALNAELKYANAINDIKLQRENARNTIRNEIAKLKAENESEKANIYNSYNNKIASYL